MFKKTNKKHWNWTEIGCYIKLPTYHCWKCSQLHISQYGHKMFSSIPSRPYSFIEHLMMFFLPKKLQSGGGFWNMTFTHKFEVLRNWLPPFCDLSKYNYTCPTYFLIYTKQLKNFNSVHSAIYQARAKRGRPHGGRAERGLFTN